MKGHTQGPTMPDPLIYGPILSYLGIIAFVTLTGAGLPIPEEVFVVGAAVAAAAGTLDPWAALAACMAGVLLGDSLMYFLGAHFGRGLLNEQRWFARMLSPAVEAHIERLIRQHGIKMFLAARFLVGLRAPFYITSGILRIGYRRFLMLDFICTCINIGTFFALAYFLSEYYGEAISQRIRDAEWLVTGIVVLVAIATAVYYYVDWLCRRGLSDESIESAPLRSSDWTTADEKGSVDCPYDSDRLEHVA